LHLRGLLSAQLGTSFVASKVQVRFHEVDGADVCQVDIAPGSEPLIITVKDKNGQPVERFYVRSGNSSPEMSLSEMSAYMKERFHR
jgi:hypothetical protein